MACVNNTSMFQNINLVSLNCEINAKYFLSNVAYGHSVPVKILPPSVIGFKTLSCSCIKTNSIALFDGSV